MKFIITKNQRESQTIRQIATYVRAACIYDEVNRVWSADDMFAKKDLDLQELIQKEFVQVVADDYSDAPKKVYSAADLAADDREFFADQNPWILRGR